MLTGSDLRSGLVGSRPGAGGLGKCAVRGVTVDDCGQWIKLTLPHAQLPYDHFEEAELQMFLTGRLLGTCPLELLSGLAGA